jgi:hypothetical protein
LAARSVAYSFKRQFEQTAQALNRLYPLYSKLNSLLMRQLLEYVYAKNRPNLDSLKTGLERDKEWDKRLMESESSDGN